jgi:hypothetical protein
VTAPVSRSRGAARGGGRSIASLTVLLGFGVLDDDGDAEELSIGEREGLLNGLKLDKLDVADSA